MPINLNPIQRLDQLHSKGTSPELIDCLANDAQKLAELRSILRSQVCDARKFITNYCQLYYANQVPKDLGLLIDDFELDITSHLEQLDQIVRDLLQIVSIAFASSLRRELHRLISSSAGIRMGISHRNEDCDQTRTEYDAPHICQHLLHAASILCCKFFNLAQASLYAEPRSKWAGR